MKVGHFHNFPFIKMFFRYSAYVWWPRWVIVNYFKKTKKLCRIIEVKLLNSGSLSESKRRLSKYFTAKRQTLLLNKSLNKYKRLSAIKIMVTKKLSKTHIKGKRKSPFGSQLFEEFALYFSRTRGNSWPFDRVHLHCVLKNMEMLT